MKFWWQDFAMVAEFWNIQSGRRCRQWISSLFCHPLSNQISFFIYKFTNDYFRWLVELWIHFDHEKCQETFHEHSMEAVVKYCFHCTHLVNQNGIGPSELNLWCFHLILYRVCKVWKSYWAAKSMGNMRLFVTKQAFKMTFIKDRLCLYNHGLEVSYSSKIHLGRVPW